MEAKYIFHFFNSLESHHLEMALDSILGQAFAPMDFVLFNSSKNDTDVLLRTIQSHLGKQFKSYTSLERREGRTTLADVQTQISIIDGADFYFLHKADFVLGRGLIQRSLNYAGLNPEPFFLNFCKFDLRENVTEPEVRQLAQLSYADILRKQYAMDITAGPDESRWGTHIRAIGYAGWDGVMHCYNEAARARIIMDSFIEWHTVKLNREHGISWKFGNTDYVVFHLFHALPGGRGSPDKDIPGHRY